MHIYDDALRGFNWVGKQAAITEGVSGRVDVTRYHLITNLHFPWKLRGRHQDDLTAPFTLAPAWEVDDGMTPYALTLSRLLLVIIAWAFVLATRLLA